MAHLTHQAKLELMAALFDLEGRTAAAQISREAAAEIARLEGELKRAEAARAKERAGVAQEVNAYADSIDEFTTTDDIYSGLTDLASEIRKGDYA